MHGTPPPKLTPGVATFMAPWPEREGAQGLAGILKRHLEKGRYYTSSEEIFWPAVGESLLYSVPISKVEDEARFMSSQLDSEDSVKHTARQPSF